MAVRPVPSRERRRHPVGHDPRREKRRAEAIARDEIYRSLSIEDKLALLEGRPGESARERARLEAA